MEQPLEALLDACSLFEETLRNDESVSEKQRKICCFMEKMCENPVSVGDFKVGLEWFNCAEPLSLGLQLKGKVVVLDFFTYCCINCLHILPYLRQLEETFSIEDGVVIVGVHSAKFNNEKDSNNILAALRRYDITHPVVNDCDGELWTKLGISCWPTLLILGPKGQPIFKLVGEFPENKLLDLVSSAVKFFKSRGDLSPHLLPPHSTTSVCKGPLMFPGKITSTTQEDGSELIAIANTGLHTVIVASSCGTIKHIIGSTGQPGFLDGGFTSALFNAPQGVAFSSFDVLFVADTENHAIRKVDLQKEIVETVAGHGQRSSDCVGGSCGAAQGLSSPWDICFIRRRVPTPQRPPAPPGYTGLSDSSILQQTPSGLVPPPPLPVSMAGALVPPPPTLPCLLVDNVKEDCVEQEILMIAMAGSHQIWALFFQDTLWWGKEYFAAGTCANVAGSGLEANRNNTYPHSAAFAQPSGLTFCPELDKLFIADSESSSVRSIDLKTGKVSAVVGGSKSPNDLFSYGDVDGSGDNAKLQHPLGVAWHDKTKSLFVADSYNHKIKCIKLEKSASCASYIGTGNAGNSASGLESQLNEPGGICISTDELMLYIADTNNHSIKVFTFDKSSVTELSLQYSETLNENPDVHDEATPLQVGFNGKINFHVKISLPPQSKLTEGAPQRWTLKLPDSNWTADSLSGNYDPDQPLTISVVAPSHQQNYNLLSLSIKLFICVNSMCKAVSSSASFSIKCNHDACMVLDQNALFVLH